MVEIPLFVMTIGTIAVPTSFHETFGKEECIAYNLMFPTSNVWGIICGFTMGVYRWTCTKGKRYGINYFIGLAFGLMTLLLMNAPFIIDPKTSPGYQFCIGIQSPTITTVTNGNDSTLDKILKARFLLVVQALVLSEFMIYVCILKEQQKHNEKHLQEKIINRITFKVRREKNVITLNGQLGIFATRMVLSMLVMITNVFKIQVLDVSELPIVVIMFSYVVTTTQVLSSHEMRKFLKSKLE